MQQYILCRFVQAGMKKARGCWYVLEDFPSSQYRNLDKSEKTEASVVLMRPESIWSQVNIMTIIRMASFLDVNVA